MDELKKILNKENVTFTLKIEKNENVIKNVSISNNVLFDLMNKRVKLNSGYYMPTNGLGTWSLYGDTAYNSVYNALKASVRLIDTAQYYGNEEEVGKALKKQLMKIL